jgi:hypothetical protein
MRGCQERLSFDVAHADGDCAELCRRGRELEIVEAEDVVAAPLRFG